MLEYLWIWLSDPFNQLLETMSLKLQNHDKEAALINPCNTDMDQKGPDYLRGRCALRIYLHGTWVVGMSQLCLGWNLTKICIALIVVVLGPGLWGLLRSIRHYHRPNPKKASWHSTSLGVWTELAHIYLWLTGAKQALTDGLPLETMWQTDVCRFISCASQIFALCDKWLLLSAVLYSAL